MNAAAIPTTLRGGREMATLASSWTQKSMRTSRQPTEPGLYAQHGLGESAAAQADASAIHNEGRKIYDLDKNVNAALKQEIIAAVEETYLSAKKQQYMGFHGVSTKNLVDHLMERYDKISASDL